MKTQYERIQELEEQVAWLMKLHIPKDHLNISMIVAHNQGLQECPCRGQNCGPTYKTNKD